MKLKKKMKIHQTAIEEYIAQNSKEVCTQWCNMVLQEQPAKLKEITFYTT